MFIYASENEMKKEREMKTWRPRTITIARERELEREMKRTGENERELEKQNETELERIRTGMKNKQAQTVPKRLGMQIASMRHAMQKVGMKNEFPRLGTEIAIAQIWLFG